MAPAEDTAGRGLSDEVADYLFYAPVGLVLTVGEQLPKLVEKGRARVEQRVTVARAIGQFAVMMGRRKVEDLWQDRAGSGKGAGSGKSGGAGTDRAAAATTPSTGTDRTNRTDDDAADVADPGHGADGSGSFEHPGAITSAPGSGELERDPAATPGDDAAAGSGVAILDPASLAIPGYDSLAASQVVQRLESLSREELEDVRRYEQATRARRTILGRVNQLTASEQA
jgi:hypothetical protein